MGRPVGGSPPARDPVRGRVRALLETTPHRVVAEFAGESRLAADLTECVTELGRVVPDDLPVISAATREILGGGKRLRPLLVLTTAYCGPADRERSIGAAVAVELLHVASLVHDDVMDEAPHRHGVASANARTGNIRAILAGDYLLAQALATAGRLGRAECLLAAETFVRLCEGQAHESAALFDVARQESAYYTAIGGKTGALFAASCRLGAMAAGLGAEATAALGDFGLHLGVAYQLIDDLLDLSSSSGVLGKPAGHDVLEGVYTLPVLHTLRAHPPVADLLRRARTGLDGAEEAAREVADVVRDSGGLTVARRAAEHRTALAVGALSGAAGEIDATGIAMLTELVAALVGRGR